MAESESQVSAREVIPPKPTLSSLREASSHCRACDLWKNATQTVFGDGRRRARVFVIGEQPGNEEDLGGKPFIGPAGRLLNQALEAAGLDREWIYATNVVKHFRWVRRGKRRIHKKPNSEQIEACKPWLDAELAIVKPEVIICLGATASHTLLGKDFRVTERRGEFIDSPLAPKVIATVHPSSILRARDNRSRQIEFERFVNDLKKVAAILASARER